MAGLPWARLDGAFPTHPKVLALLQHREGHRAGFVYLCGLAYTVQHGTDGVIAVGALPWIHGRKVDADRLVNAGLWHEYPDGGWLIHGWDERQMTTEGKASQSQAAREAANIRWHGRREGSA